jgi:hypothetical protein
MKRILLAKLVPLLGIALILPGCAEQEGAMPGREMQISSPDATIHLNEVVFIDRDLQADASQHFASKVAVEGKGIAQNAGGTYGVFALFRNRTQNPLQLECRVQFFGTGKEPVEGPSSWQRVYLPPLGVGNYKESSLGSFNLAYYYIEVREGR